MKPSLLVLAAGMGSRYGGLKQIDPVGPSQEAIIEYSVHDAIRAGFGKVVFVIRKNIEEAFKEKFGHLANRIAVEYAYQSTEVNINGVSVAERVKPWGTAHAVLSAKDLINEPFAMINADDYYGQDCFKEMANFLEAQKANQHAYSMMAYSLEKTLSPHGSVSRGVCTVNSNDSLLVSVEEFTQIEREGGAIKYTTDAGEKIEMAANTPVSMNFWGLTPAVFGEIETMFVDFLKENSDNPKAEFYIPTVINNLMNAGKATVKVLNSPDQWYGVTYPEDKDVVVQAFKSLTDSGKYTDPLWT